MAVNTTDTSFSKFKPNFLSYFVGLIAILFKLFAYFNQILGLAIILIEGLREFINWSIVFILVGLLIHKISYRLYANYGPATLIFMEEGLVIKLMFGKVNVIPDNRLLHLHFSDQSNRLGINVPQTIEIYTSDDRLTLSTFRWSNQSAITDKLHERYQELDNIYVKNYFYKNTLKNTFSKILNSFQGKVGLAILLIYSIMAIWGGLAYLIDPPNPTKARTLFLWNPEFIVYFLPEFKGTLNPPNSTFLFGTDYAGRDLFSRLVYGTTITLSISLIAAFIITLLIIFFGLSTAIYGGWWDDIVTRVSDVLLTFPQVVWIILISAFSTPFRLNIPGGYFLAVYLGMSLVMWPLGARLVRSEVLETFEAEYVQAVKMVGASKWWIIKNHVVPKVFPTVILLFFYQLSDIIIGISLLGYLGFDSESTIVWGSDLAKAFQAENLEYEWWTILFPSLFIFVMVLGLTLFSDALRDTYASRFKGGIQTTLHSSIGGN